MTLIDAIAILEDANEEYTVDTVAKMLYPSEDTFSDDVLVAIDDEISELMDIQEDSLEDEDALLLDSVEEDGAKRPKRKAGYKPKLVVRGGKKVWVNKRDPNKKVFLSPAQKNALRKARLKSNTGQAKLKRKRAMKIRKRFVG